MKAISGTPEGKFTHFKFLLTQNTTRCYFLQVFVDICCTCPIKKATNKYPKGLICSKECSLTCHTVKGFELEVTCWIISSHQHIVGEYLQAQGELGASLHNGPGISGCPLSAFCSCNLAPSIEVEIHGPLLGWKGAAATAWQLQETWFDIGLGHRVLNILGAQTSQISLPDQTCLIIVHGRRNIVITTAHFVRFNWWLL